MARTSASAPVADRMVLPALCYPWASAQTDTDRAQGCKPQLLPFPPYTCAQIGAVLRARLSQLPGKVFTPPAIMLCARKVRLARP